MSKKPTKAELETQNESLRKQVHAANLALNFVAFRRKPEFSEIVRWVEHGDKLWVRLEAYGLERADGGVAVLTWKWPNSDPWVEVLTVLDLTQRDRSINRRELRRYALDDAITRLQRACVEVNTPKSKVG